MIKKIVSGGQTGADRGGLDAAMDAGVPHGGWCPKGRLAEDGPIPARYQLQEMETSSYIHRTEANVVDSDATVVLCFGEPTGGSLHTVELCEQHGKPCLILDLKVLGDDLAADDIIMWLREVRTTDDGPRTTEGVVLNVAGSRESKDAGLADRVRDVIGLVIEKGRGQITTPR
ncbi:hypothetical protein BVX97_02260 [bacterium E08(2017)]|nr:hypothetical protein BVX97_02260 [bacterium E08(2017)]